MKMSILLRVAGLLLLIVALVVGLCGLTPARASNLLLQSGIEPIGGAVDLSAWNAEFPKGVDGGPDTKIAHSGTTSYRINVPNEVPVSWYSLTQSLTRFDTGTTYTMSAYIRTDGIKDGAGAYVSMNFFDADGNRISYADSPEKLTHATDWRRISSTATVPPNTKRIWAILTVNGHGTAWFDDVQLEPGTTATPYVAQIVVAQVSSLAKSVPILRADRKARIAILGETAPTGNAAPSRASVLARTLDGAGYTCVTISAEQASDSAFLDPAIFDLYVVPTGDFYPARAHAALVAYLKKGGALLTTGGYAFDRAFVRYDGKWQRASDLPIGDMPQTVLFPDSGAGWTQAGNQLGSPRIESAPGPRGEPGLKVSTESLDLWDTGISPDISGKLPDGWSITRFWARGDAHTPSLSVEWHEKDGSRWKTIVALGKDWREYTLFPSDFAYWKDNPSKGRGGAADRFHPENAAKMQVGVSIGLAEPGIAHTFWFAAARVQADGAANLRGPAPHINTRFAVIRDAMWPEADQIGVFDAGYPLSRVTEVRPTPAQDIIVNFDLKAPLEGYSATALTSVGGHGAGPNRSRWLPLLACTDVYGHPRGEAAAIVHNFSGTFTGSSWAVFGITNRDLFEAGSPALKQVLLPTVASLLRHFYVHDTEAQYACYRQGEAVHLHTNISNFSRASQTGELRFIIRAQGSAAPTATLTKPVTVAPGATEPIDMKWSPDSFASDYYTISAKLVVDGTIIDHEDNAFVVWSPAVIAKGPKFGRQGTYFTVDGRPGLVFGCQTFWCQVSNVTARSPAAFERDFVQMQAMGLHWTRAFLPFGDESMHFTRKQMPPGNEIEKRINDMVVQLAQKHHIVLYDAINLINTADPAVLARQEADIEEAARRYKDVPGFAFDIDNEPAMEADDPALAKLSDKPAPTGAWTDPAPRAFWAVLAGAERRWSTGNAQAAHKVAPGLMTSVGWTSGWGEGKRMMEPLIASLDLDFTDRHYYGNLDAFASEFKDVDLRGLGKPLTVGECGAVDHPTYKAMDPWGNGTDDEGFDHRMLYMTHFVAGLGGALMSSWHLRDPMEGIFPCGQLHQDNVPKPAAAVYRACALALSRFQPVSAPPQVVLMTPDSGRMGGQRSRVIAAVHRAASLLIAAHVDFTELPDSLAGNLPGATRAVIYPIPLDPGDPVIEALTAFAQKGGVVYVSGDISYDANRMPMLHDRLKSFAGVEFKSSRCQAGADGWPLDIAKAPTATILPSAGSGLVSGKGHPVIDVSLAGATAMATASGAPVVTRLAAGKGAVWFSTDPIEVEQEMTPAHIALYRAILADAKAPVLSVTPDSPQVKVFRVAGVDCDAWLFYNGGPASNVSAGGFTLRLAERRTGLVIVGHDGSIRALEAQGSVREGGKTLASFDSHCLLVALDDVDLSRSHNLLALPLSPGSIRLPRAVSESSADVVDWKNGAWQPLGPVEAATVDGQLTIVVKPEQSREVIRVR